MRPALGSAAQQQQQQRQPGEAGAKPPAEEPPSSGSSYAAPAGPRDRPEYGIARSNVGFQLLRKAGWVEGTGLGAQEQGRPEPLLPSQQQGRLGLGRAPKKPPPAPKQPADAAEQQAAAQQAQRRPKRSLPADPLASEDFDTKVKRVRQVGARQLARRQRQAAAVAAGARPGGPLGRGPSPPWEQRPFILPMLPSLPPSLTTPALSLPPASHAPPRR